jgi:general secretion pathway protein B
MSYILEALKRADAERQRGAVPGLLASQVTTSPARAPADARRRAAWIAVAVLALGGLAVGLWRWRMPAPVPVPRVQTEAAPASVPVLAATLPNAVVAAPAQPGVATPSPTKAVAAVPTVAAPSPSPSPSPAATPPRPVAHAAPASAVSPPVPAAEPVAEAVATAPVSQVSGVQAASAGVSLLGELPQELRRQIPALSINGVVYSANPAQRLLVVNNQVLTQGSLVAPELRLEEIESKSSVFSFRGTRFRVTH